ncbi:hypothetical protein B0H10DRAFT_469676 [Mycena sp. CBHHK59/15]|nr:hypothetical protein B0H10DRAFT_469676 [Mycena sp. CBHHK59/15]
MLQPPPDISRTSYNNTISIVQSSGMGKSWMLDRVAKSLFTLPLNLRNPDKNGYPPTPSQSINFFRPSMLALMQCNAQLAAFLVALFRCATKAIHNLPAGENLPAAWRSWLKSGNTPQSVGPHRTQFYTSVVKEANMLLSQEPFQYLSVVDRSLSWRRRPHEPPSSRQSLK